MFSVDDFVKIVLALSCAFALIGISYALVRVLNKLTSTIEDVRRPIQNIGEVTDMAVTDYKGVRGMVSNIFGLTPMFKSFKKFSSLLSSRTSKDD